MLRVDVGLKDKNEVRVDYGTRDAFTGNRANGNGNGGNKKNSTNADTPVSVQVSKELLEKYKR